eukprot:CAMPEP_0173152824 /NCGR_PEP_ID=MMETSP1105-20130129/12476_1 /TAXON_ID=2985 /ORGANISM="Ochromonas sp., Strain BG-1" /LENGTH=728 /DNA_ID=CAMNT_0014068605 /DNA_START=123 /DNA_END=2306 /DNA_ORIENTATION=+
MPHAKIYDLEENKESREKKVAQDGITWYLTFNQSGDEKLYHDFLKNLFYFPSFWPMMMIFIAFTASESGLVTSLHEIDPILLISFSIHVLNFFLIVIYTIAQLFDYIRVPGIGRRFSRFLLLRFFSGHVENAIILLHAIGQGFYLLSFTSRDVCAGCGNIISLERCAASADRVFPLNQAFFSFISIIILSIYFKSMQRHVVLLAAVIIIAFIIAGYLYGSYSFEPYTVLFVLFFLVAIYELERYKMTTYLLSKDAIIAEKHQSELVHEKNKMIESKLRTALIHQILPPRVADQIIAGKQVEPESFPEVTIFFSDVEGFTTICSKVTPVEVVRMLNDLYTVMDYCTSLFPLYKVETIGDAYMVAGGLPVKDKNHAQQVADFALLVQRAVQAVKSPVDGSPIRIRIGLHSGPVMAGVVGNLMPRYCLFGDTVNTASRMESNGLPNKIHCSAATASLLIYGSKHHVAERGAIEVKGKGTMTTYWLESATDDNVASNAAAIARTEMIVQELLEASHNDRKLYPSLAMTSPSNTPPPSPRSNNKKSHSVATVEPYTMPGSGASFNNTLSSNSTIPLASPGRHTLQYTYQHGLSDNFGENYCAQYAKILVVEDSNAQRKIIIRRLQDADPTWEITGAASGEEALQKLKAAKFKFDVVFVDENLSVNNGLFGHELVQVMRDSFNMRLTVIAACTGNPTKVTKELMAAGVDIVWPKPPPTSAEIKDKINLLLNQRW